MKILAYCDYVRDASSLERELRILRYLVQDKKYKGEMHGDVTLETTWNTKDIQLRIDVQPGVHAFVITLTPKDCEDLKKNLDKFLADSKKEA